MYAGTLHNKPGGQRRLIDACQNLILETILAKWRASIDGYDIKLIVKEYLDRINYQEG